MQRINSIYTWGLVKKGEKITIISDNPEQRSVRLQINAPHKTPVYISQDDNAEPYFLALVEGLEEISFAVTGSYNLWPTDGEIWLDTLDGSRAGLEAVDDTSFTKVMGRRAVSPEIEMMQRLMYENQRRFELMTIDLQQKAAENERKANDARNAAKAAIAAVADATGAAAPTVADAVPSVAASGSTSDASAVAATAPGV